MIIDEDILKRVRDYGALDQSPRQIAFLLRIPAGEIDAFIDEMMRPDTRLHEYYAAGKAIISYNTNVELARQAEKGDSDAIKLLDQRRQDQRYQDMCTELFGI